MTAGPFGLAGKVAIVTGGNGGIGLGMARGLATAGAAIAIVGRNEAKSAEAVAGLMKDGNKAIAVAADVTDEAAVGAMVTHVRSELGRIDILVNNAGINIRKPPESLDPAEWDSVIRTNLTSAFLCSRAVHPAMKATGGGKIGGQVEQKTLRLRMSSNCLPYTVCGAAEATRGAGLAGSAPRTSLVSMAVAVARALKIAQIAMTARSIAQRYLRSSVSMETQGVPKQRRGQRAARETPVVLRA